MEIFVNKIPLFEYAIPIITAIIGLLGIAYNPKENPKVSKKVICIYLLLFLSTISLGAITIIKNLEDKEQSDKRETIITEINENNTNLIKTISLIKDQNRENFDLTVSLFSILNQIQQGLASPNQLNEKISKLQKNEKNQQTERNNYNLNSIRIKPFIKRINRWHEPLKFIAEFKIDLPKESGLKDSDIEKIVYFSNNEIHPIFENTKTNLNFEYSKNAVVMAEIYFKNDIHLPKEKFITKKIVLRPYTLNIYYSMNNRGVIEKLAEYIGFEGYHVKIDDTDTEALVIKSDKKDETIAKMVQELTEKFLFNKTNNQTKIQNTFDRKLKKNWLELWISN